jgi:hypothetical protein
MTTEIKSSDHNSDGCICKGNWRAIIAEAEPLMDKKFVEDRTGDIFTFIGALHGSDDYYYLMSRENSIKLLSCAGNIVGHGYTLLENGVD